MTSTDKTFTTKLGKTSAGERSRIWIEGARLEAHGFTPKTKFLKIWRADGTLLLAKEGTKLSGEDANTPATIATVSGKGTKPIIDITGAKVVETFGSGTHVLVTYRANRITIKKVEA
jgi:hypothetical protein